MANYSTHNPQNVILLSKIKEELVELNKIAPDLLDSGSGIVPEIKGLMPLQSGQTTSYATGDDGDLQRGRLTDFNTLPYNNGFGNTYRFTDELGGQTFTNNIIIDWSTWDGDTDVNGYILSINSDSDNATQTWATWISGQPYTTGGFGSWYVVNVGELNTLMNYETTNGLNYSPFNNSTGGGGLLWTTTTSPNNTANALYKNRNTYEVRQGAKTSSYNSLLVRTFNWDGVSLT